MCCSMWYNIQFKGVSKSNCNLWPPGDKPAVGQTLVASDKHVVGLDSSRTLMAKGINHNGIIL